MIDVPVTYRVTFDLTVENGTPKAVIDITLKNRIAESVFERKFDQRAK